MWFNRTGSMIPGSLTDKPWWPAVARYAPLVPVAAILIWHSLQFDFVADDAYISFVYARNFAEHGELTFNLGQPVEGYTNFLWTFVLGLLMIPGLAPEITSLILGTGFGIATLVVAARLGAVIGARDSAWNFVAPALLALSAGYACWSSGGLETQMFVFWIALAVYGYTDIRCGYRLTGIALALAAMTRPEGLLVAACIGLHRLVGNYAISRRLRPERDELVGAGWFLLLWAPWFLWRWWYYGHPLPNTYYVKAAGEASDHYLRAIRESGFHYVWQWALQSGAIWAAPVAVIGAVAHSRRTAALRFGTLALLITIAYLFYAVRVGGDFMGLHRFVMPLFFVVAMLTVLGLRRLVSVIPKRPWRAWLAVGAVTAIVGLHGLTQIELTARAIAPGNLGSDNGIDTPAYLALYSRDRARIGEHMRQCFRDGDFSIFGGVGAKPYFARAEGIDVFGLVSERIAHEVARTRARPGHNKWGPNELLAGYDPDFVFSCYSLHRAPREPRWNCSTRDVEFWTDRGYRAVTVRIPGLRESGEYYTFLVKEARGFRCPGMLE